MRRIMETKAAQYRIPEEIVERARYILGGTASPNTNLFLISCASSRSKTLCNPIACGE